MILIGPDFWGLTDRDIPGTKESNAAKVDLLYDFILKRGKGIHISEISQYVEVEDDSSKIPSAYVLMNIAQRDERFYLSNNMYLALSAWGEDVRRLNISQAVKKFVANMQVPMKISEIEYEIENLIEMPLEMKVNRLLFDEGVLFDSCTKNWYKKGS